MSGCAWDVSTQLICKVILFVKYLVHEVYEPPNRAASTLRRLARLLEHEVRHTFGEEHKDMTTKVYWSLGPLPAWARGARVRYDNGRILK